MAVLPFVGYLSRRHHQRMSLRPAPDVVLPPTAVPPPIEKRPELPPKPTAAPKPAKPAGPSTFRRQIRLLSVALPLSTMTLDARMNEVSLHFRLESPGDTDRAITSKQDLLFELDQLDRAPRPLVRLQPLYPLRAKKRKITGFVEVEFVITPSGKVTDVTVVRSEPGDLFVRTSVSTVSRWRFTPPRKGGKPVSARARQVLRFQLPER
jgi:protein TonB